MRRSRFVLFAAFALALAGPASHVPGATGIAAGNWPQWRGPQRNGLSPDIGLLAAWPQAGPPLAWTGKGLGAGFSSLAVVGGRIYTMGDRRDGQYVIALNEENGQPVWATRVGGTHNDEYGGPRCTPTIDGALLYVVTTDGDVVSLDTATGRERWRRSMPNDFGGRMMSSWMFAESPLVDGDRVIVTPGGSRAGIVALNKATGADIWRATIPALGSAGADGAGYSSVVISNGGGVKQYIQLMGRGVVSVRAADGVYMWGYNRIANGVANISTPIVSGNLIFASTGYGDGGSAILEVTPAANGRVGVAERQYFNAGQLQNHHGGFVLIDGVVYGGHGHSNGFPFALELATGRQLWARTRGAGTGSAAVAGAERHLYFRYENGTMALVAANPKQYELRSSFSIPNVRNPSWSHPVITGGRLYLREQDALYAYAIQR
jgi:outer membrane protein assembly factor BamB